MTGRFIVRRANPWRRGGAKGGVLPEEPVAGPVIVVYADAAGATQRAVCDVLVDDDGQPEIPWGSIARWLPVDEVV